MKREKDGPSVTKLQCQYSIWTLAIAMGDEIPLKERETFSFFFFFSFFFLFFLLLPFPFPFLFSFARLEDLLLLLKSLLKIMADDEDFLYGDSAGKFFFLSFVLSLFFVLFHFVVRFFHWPSAFNTV